MRRYTPLFALAAWAAAIFIASSIPNPPDAGGQDWKYELAHVLEYGIFGALAFVALRQYFPDRSLFLLASLAWLLGVAYGISDEFHQSFVPNRDAGALDVGFDALGAAIGVTTVVLIRVRRRRSSPTPFRGEGAEG